MLKPTKSQKNHRPLDPFFHPINTLLVSSSKSSLNGHIDHYRVCRTCVLHIISFYHIGLASLGSGLLLPTGLERAEGSGSSSHPVVRTLAVVCKTRSWLVCCSCQEIWSYIQVCIHLSSLFYIVWFGCLRRWEVADSFTLNNYRCL